MRAIEERIKNYLLYNEITGELFWIKSPKYDINVGDEAGSITNQGYVKLTLLKKQLTAHRIIWFMVYGYWPNEIDHINGIRTDNRLVNLREVTRTQNMRNSCSNKGFKGVSYHKRDKKFHSRIWSKGKNIHLGSYSSEIEAASAYNSKAKELFGEYARLNLESSQ